MMSEFLIDLPGVFPLLGLLPLLLGLCVFLEVCPSAVCKPVALDMLLEASSHPGAAESCPNFFNSLTLNMQGNSNYLQY